ncbi:amidohydrolase family protein [Streptomyces phaeolivaceus]|uniref:Amidohydrolase family protein n=1 Tax=Streptomyces phaeolivaceus TaxID=2653200 RepID=A0A5P8KEY1_9ACTN|nr:amidohydrolase family protein [Streptomyces phaeolivaceus]QFR01712.1 amidohydrolase family protein [Streptomyces phaeolivaceus]
MRRTVFTGGLVFDGTGTEPFPGEVVVEDGRIAQVTPGWSDDTDRDETALRVDCTGRTVMPGLIEAHSHLTFPSAVGHLEPGFNPPLDVSFFHRPFSAPAHLEMAERNARILLDAGFTTAYSAGSLTPGAVEVRLRDRIRSGAVPGPRLRAASFERDSSPFRSDGIPLALGPQSVQAFVAEQASLGFDNVKFLLSNDDVFTPGGSQQTQYSEEEAQAASRQAREDGVWLNCHAQSAEAVKLAARNGFRAVYHCTYADEEALDLLEARKDDDLFVAPAVGIVYANVHEGEEFGITAEVAESMGQPQCLETMAELYPEMRRRGIPVLPGGDYGFPNNPIGRNARDLDLFVRVFGYTPAAALSAATMLGGRLMGMGDELGLLAPGYLADLLVVRGNPVEDVTLLEDRANLLAIVQEGRFHKADAVLGLAEAGAGTG